MAVEDVEGVDRHVDLRLLAGKSGDGDAVKFN